MKTVAAYEARTHLSGLLEDVARGETITITKHGVPVAKLVPPDGSTRTTGDAAVRSFREVRRGKTLGDISLQELIEEGRRY